MHKPLSELVPALAWAAISTMSQQSGSIWTRTASRRKHLYCPLGLYRNTGAKVFARLARTETVALMDRNTLVVPTAPAASLVRPPQARPDRQMGRTVTHNQRGLTGRLRKARAPTSTLAFWHWRRQWAQLCIAASCATMGESISRS